MKRLLGMVVPLGLLLGVSTTACGTAAATVPCGHPVVTHPAFTAQQEFFPKGSAPRKFVDRTALVATADGKIGLNRLIPDAVSRTSHPPFDAQPFDVVVRSAAGNTVAISVPKGVKPYKGIAITEINNSLKLVAKYFPRVVNLPNQGTPKTIAKIAVGEVRYAEGSVIYADAQGCYYLDERANSWPTPPGESQEVAIIKTAAGYTVISATKAWEPVYPVSSIN